MTRFSPIICAVLAVTLTFATAACNDGAGDRAPTNGSPSGVDAQGPSATEAPSTTTGYLPSSAGSAHTGCYDTTPPPSCDLPQPGPLPDCPVEAPDATHHHGVEDPLPPGCEHTLPRP